MKKKALKLCPFCGAQIEVVPTDSTGVVMEDSYMLNPKHGLMFALVHDQYDDDDCPISHEVGEQLGDKIYDTIDDAILSWNDRT